MLHSWVADFLNSKSYFVFHNGFQSALVSASLGIMQGSVVRPRLFSIFISDLLKLATSLQVILYANDGKAVGKVSSFNDELCI